MVDWLVVYCLMDGGLKLVLMKIVRVVSMMLMILVVVFCFLFMFLFRKIRMMSGRKVIIVMMVLSWFCMKNCVLFDWCVGLR